MQGPEFNNDGDLPPGLYPAMLSDVAQHFGISTLQRRIVMRRLERIYHLARSTNQLARFIVFGSFVTRKPEPNDVDICMLMEDTFDLSQVMGGAKVVFDHMTAQNSEGASVFWIRRMAAIGGEQEAI